MPDKVKSGKTAPAKKTGALPVDGTAITYPDPIISEEGQVTMSELAEYYAAVAPFMLPRITGHPLGLLRCPSGINGECFFQRNPARAWAAMFTLLNSCTMENYTSTCKSKMKRVSWR
jgi:bifunctional non-homologous end joining protein LigD